MEWVEQAKALPCGRQLRVQCCGDDRSRVISHQEKGYSTTCFRCGKQPNEWVAKGVRTYAEMKQQRAELDEYRNQKGAVRLPDDYSTEIPAIGMQWFLKAGVSVKTAEHYKFGWSDKLGRVVIPVYNDQDELIAVQCRGVHPDQKPKYLNQMGQYNDGKYFHSDWSIPKVKEYDPIIITEDILSAIRVGSSYRAISTLGTYLSPKVALEAVRASEGQPVLIWYDGDSAGKKGAIRAYNQLSSMTDCKILTSEHDPKTYGKDYIQEFIAFTEKRM